MIERIHINNETKGYFLALAGGSTTVDAKATPFSMAGFA
jgi:hypothetical protein